MPTSSVVMYLPPSVSMNRPKALSNASDLSLRESAQISAFPPPNGNPATDQGNIDNYVQLEETGSGIDVLVDANGVAGGVNFVDLGFVSGFSAGDTVNVIVDELGNAELVTVMDLA